MRLPAPPDSASMRSSGTTSQATSRTAACWTRSTPSPIFAPNGRVPRQGSPLTALFKPAALSPGGRAGLIQVRD